MDIQQIHQSVWFWACWTINLYKIETNHTVVKHRTFEPIKFIRERKQFTEKKKKSSHRDEQKIFENIMVWQGSFIHHILFILTCSLYFPSPRKLLYEGDWSCYLPEFFFIKQWNMYSYYFDKSAFYYLLTSLKMNKIETLDQGILVNQNNILRV